MKVIEIENKCSNCGEQLTSENYDGWFEIQLNEFGIEVQVPVCNSCNLEDDGSGAY